MTLHRLLPLYIMALLGTIVQGFVSLKPSFGSPSIAFNGASYSLSPTAVFLSDADFLGTDDTKERLSALVENHPVLLFMKGSKLFPQCGFSNTAVQILNSFGVDYHTVDVLSDDNIRQGVKEFSQWPTIPQLYVCGEFIGGSDIMIEMYQNGELGEMIEKAKADMI
jgi:monothiol glutaredoxin